MPRVWRVIIPVQDHLIAIQHHPELFNLSARDVSGTSLDVLRDVAVDLIRDGWIRFRSFAPQYFFEINELSNQNIAKIKTVLLGHKAFEKETVLISTLEGRKSYKSSVKGFFYKSMFKRTARSEKLNKWRFGSCE